jgi:hypothetical protein
MDWLSIIMGYYNMRIKTSLTLTMACIVAAGCATHKAKPLVSNPKLVATGGTTGSMSTDSDIQLLALNAGTNKVPDLVPDASLAQPAIRTPLANGPLNAIELPKQPKPLIAVVVAEPNAADTLVTTAPTSCDQVASSAGTKAVRPKIWKINPLNP